MNIFLDTSSLLKLYHFEDGTTKLINFIQNNPVITIYISEITLVEMYSAIFKKVRTGELDDNKVEKFLEIFQDDVHKFSVVLLNTQTVKTAQQLLTVYGNRGLRALDSLQLASAVNVKDTISLAITHDDLLKTFLIAENINTNF